MQAGYPIDLIFQLAVRAINGIYNRSNRPLGSREADPEFYPLLDALRRQQLSEAIGFRLEKHGPEETSLITIRGDKVTPAWVPCKSSISRKNHLRGNDAPPRKSPAAAGVRYWETG